MLSMNRIWCGSFCMMSELVRVPSPKNRTPRISVPSVTPVAAKTIRAARREILRSVNPLEVGDPHRAAPLFVLGLVDDEAREDLAVQAAHRRRGQHALGRAARPHDRVHTGADDRRGDAGRQVAVADQADARAGGADVGDELLVPLTIEHDHDEIVDVAAEAARNRLQVVRHRRIEADGILRAGPDDELFHVEIGGVQQTAALGRREHGDRVGGAGRAEVRAFQRIDGDVDFGAARRPRGRAILRVRHADLLADVQHRRFIALALADHDRAVDRHRVHDPPHRLDGDLVGLVAVALSHRVGAGDRRLLDDAQKFEREIGIQHKKLKLKTQSQRTSILLLSFQF